MKQRFKAHYFTEEKLYRWEERLNQYPELKAAVELMNIITSHGFECVLVGGIVRDLILDNKPNDADLTTNANPDEIENIFGKVMDIGKNKKMGVSVVPYKGYNFEIATWRKDVYEILGNGKGADKVEITSSLKDDLERRDYTINGICIDKDGNIIDMVNGIDHIKNKIISTIGDPNLRFKEDQVRTMRGIRFASRLGFNIDDKTMKAIQSNAPEIQKVAAERITKELLKMSEQSGAKFAAAIDMLDKSNLLEYILPEIYGLKEMPHNPIHHPEGGSKILGHVLEALKTIKEADSMLNICVLFHDVGKLTTHGDGHTYHGHASAAVPLIEQISQRLKLDTETKEALLFTAENHMKIADIPVMSNNKIAKLMSNKNFDLLMKVAEADWKARGSEMFNQKEWNDIQNKIASIREKFKDNDAISAIKKIVNGNLVMSVTGLKGGKIIGNIINTIVDDILDNKIDINDTEKIISKIKELRDVF